MSSSKLLPCDTCGGSISRGEQTPMASSRSLYCSNACRQRSYRQRRKAGAAGAVSCGGPLTQLSSFVGRTDEMVELGRLLRSVRLLTLTGPAGVGKTRLAVELAGQERRSRHCEVVVVELAALADVGPMRQRIAAALGGEAEAGALPVPPAGEKDGRDCLLVLDSCEHVLDECGLILGELLLNRPNLRVLATSSESLRLPGEMAYAVSGLALPDPIDGSLLTDHLRSDAVRLFTDRARAVLSDFQLTQDNAAHIAAICTRLDGMPLAIELAARQIRMFPPDEINARLDDRLSLLTGGWRLADVRHQSLRASLHWSYDRLTPVEQALLRRLSVLPGGFCQDVAVAVAADDSVPAAAVSELLAALDRKSVITPCVDDAGPARYRLLESTRCYGHERLLAEGEEQRTYGRLVTWLAALAGPFQEAAIIPPEPLRRLELERGNLTHALDWLSTGSDERQLLLAGALAMAEMTWRPAESTYPPLLRALERTAPQSRYRAIALEGAAVLVGRDGDSDEAVRLAEQAVALEFCRRREPLFRRLLLLLSTVRESQGDRDGAYAALGECLAISRDLNDSRLTDVCLGALAQHLLLNGDPTRARQLVDQALPGLRAEALTDRLRAALLTAGAVALEQDDLSAAEAYLAEALDTSAGHPRDAARALEGLGVIAVCAYEFEHGLQLMVAAEEIDPSARSAGSSWQERVGAARAVALSALPRKRADDSRAAGHSLLPQQAVSCVVQQQAHLCDPLSQRERNVVALLVEGLTNRQIAGRLHLSVRTIETHIHNIRATLGLRSRAHVAAWAAQQRPIAGNPSAPWS